MRSILRVKDVGGRINVESEAILLTEEVAGYSSRQLRVETVRSDKILKVNLRICKCLSPLDTGWSNLRTEDGGGARQVQSC